MTRFIPSGKWKRKGASLPRSVLIAKAKSKKPKVVSRKKAEAAT
jgi:hypothetical protein